MLKELFDAIVESGRKAQEIVTCKPAAEPSHVYTLRNADGSLSYKHAQPAPRQHKALDLTAIRELAARLDGEGDIAIWVSRQGVVALLDDESRRDTVSLLLAPSEQMALLTRLAAQAVWQNQKDFVRVLRINLAGCVPGSLLPIVRKTKFRLNAEGESEIGHGKSSMGRSMERELTGAGNVPEQVTLEVPIWTGFMAFHPYKVECALEIDPATEMFALIPLPGQVEKAWRAGEADLLRQMATLVSDCKNVWVHYGTP